MDRIVILTGAGISAESGLGTFRDADGLWAKYDLNEVATPEGFARNPALVHDFYNARRSNCRAAAPNPAHTALARLQQAKGTHVTLVTQNVDDLHERGGSPSVWHMHGELERAKCGACNHHWGAPETMAPADPCPACAAPMTRPDIVWFGEFPYLMDEIHDALTTCDLFVSIGTSGEVYPAAGFVQIAAEEGAHTLELNQEPTPDPRAFAEQRHGPASRVVPQWVDEILNAGSV